MKAGQSNGSMDEQSSHELLLTHCGSSTGSQMPVNEIHHLLQSVLGDNISGKLLLK